MLTISNKGRSGAKEHMARDRKLLDEGSVDNQLFFYEWSDFCVTYGLFANPESFMKDVDVEIASRPTGGGILFHQDDMPFSLFLPQISSWESLWVKIQKNILRRISPFLGGERQNSLTPVRNGPRFCMAEAHECDFVWNGKKFGGAAFRKSKKGLLCQASLFVGDPPWEKSAACLKDPSLVVTMKTMSRPLPSACTKVFLQEVVAASIREVL